MNSKRLVTMFSFVIILSLLAGFTGTSRAEFSSTSATLELAWYFTGEQTGCEMGSEVANAGDLNNDGFADFAISAPKGSDGEDREGIVYIFYGPVPANNPYPDLTLSNDRKGSQFGSAISSGDINCDGIDDLVIGAPLYKAGDEMPEAGAVYVYYGRDGSELPSDAPPDWSLVGSARDIRFGDEIAAGGDVVGDSCMDLAVAAPLDSNGEDNEGRVYVYQGSPSGPVSTTVQILEVNQISALFGKALSIAGDVNNDGKEDVLVGAPQYNNREDLENILYDAGAAFLYYGSDSGLNETEPDWAAYGERSDDNFGIALDSTGDINNDTYDDVLIGIPFWDGTLLDNEGRVQSYMGSASGLYDTSYWYATGKATYSKFGIALSTAGDVTGDGIDDLVIGMPFTSGSSGGTGQDEPESIVVFEGNNFGFFSNPSFSVVSNQSSTEFGTAIAIVASQSVLDGVYGDIIVGAPQYMRDDKDKLGQAFVYYGNATSGEAPLAIEMLFPLVVGTH